MQTAAHHRARSSSAILCLLAAALLYAPLATTAWSSYSAACCTSDQCPIPEHHHHKSPATPTHHMDCGHDMVAMMACSMSCCPNTERPAVASAVFVLPAPFQLAAPAGFTSAIHLVNSLDSPRFIEPLSPPPRFATAVA
jgi:hypothetical protein